MSEPSRRSDGCVRFGAGEPHGLPEWLLISLTAEVVEAELAGGNLRCPGCERPLAQWEYARERRIRMPLAFRDGVAVHCFMRAGDGYGPRLATVCSHRGFASPDRTYGDARILRTAFTPNFA